MSDLEQDIRELLDEEVRSAPPPHEAGIVVRRTRRRQGTVIAGGALAAVALVAASLVGLRAIDRTERPTFVNQPTITTTINGIAMSHPEGWYVVDPDEAGLNGPNPTPDLPKLILAVAPFDPGELFACPGMAQGTPHTFLMTVQEEPLALPGGAAAPWPVELEPLGVDASESGCYPGWEFLRAGWTTAGRTFEARVGFAPDVSDTDRDALFAAFASMAFAESGIALESVVLATGTAGGEDWQLIARRQSDGVSLMLDAESFGTGTGGYTADPDELQLTSHVFGEGDAAEIVVFGAAPPEIASIEAFPAMGSPAVSVEVLDVPEEIDPRLNAFVLIVDADLPVELNAYDADGNVVLRGRVGAAPGPVETPLPGELLYRGRTNDCFWRINAVPQAATPADLQLVPDDGTGSVVLPLELGPDAPALQLTIFRCEFGGTLAFGLVTSDTREIRWLPNSGDELLEEVGCVETDLPSDFCFFLSDHVDFTAGGQTIALDADGDEIGRATFP